VAKTLQELGDDWVSFGVSIVDNPAVPKAKWLAIKSQNSGEASMGEAYVRQRRAELGMSQEAVATKAGIGRVEVSQLETGQRGLSAAMAKKLAPALSMKSGSLLARQLGSQGVAAVKEKGAPKSSVHRLIADLEDFKGEIDDEEEKAAFTKAIDELQELLKDDGAKPDDSDTAEKSQRRSARQGRDGYGRRRRDEDRADIGRDTATKSQGKRERDAYGRRR
jgi:transcriptional regulator with XRE-family HTH domain